LWLAAIPAWAALADRVGRKPVLIIGTLSSGALVLAYLAAIDSRSYVLIFVAAIAMSGVAYSAFNGVQPALYGEMFPTKVRLSGMAIGTQIGCAIGGFAPTAAAASRPSGYASRN
jgi:MFS family permease